jgi:short-subunit dehydrogenase
MKLSDSFKQRFKSTYGPCAVVTGATSGIGLELARLIASAGLDLVLCARSKSRLAEISDELRREHGIKVTTFSVDLSVEQGLHELISLTDPMQISLFVHSAGFGTSDAFVRGAIAEEVNMLRLNCESAVVLTHHYARRFLAQGKGGVILMSSLVAFQGVPYAAHYAATKAYIQSLAEGLARELAGTGVHVLAAAPGPVDSGFGARANMRMSGALRPSQVAVPILKALGRRTTVLPGLLTKVLVYSLRTVPRWAKVRIMEKVMGGMTAHRR